jgi:hypothetical protein
MKRKAKLLAINAQAHILDHTGKASPRKGHHRHSETAMTTLGGTQKPVGKFFSALPSPNKGNNKGTTSIFLTGLGELAAVSPVNPNTRLSSISPNAKAHSRVQFYNTSAAPKSALSTI